MWQELLGAVRDLHFQNFVSSLLAPPIMPLSVLSSPFCFIFKPPDLGGTGLSLIVSFYRRSRVSLGAFGKRPQIPPRGCELGATLYHSR